MKKKKKETERHGFPLKVVRPTGTPWPMFAGHITIYVNKTAFPCHFRILLLPTMATSPAPKRSTAGGEPLLSKTPPPTPPRRSAVAWLGLLLVLVNCSWATYHFQYESLPAPLSPEQAGKRGFSEVSAMAHVEALTRLGPHPVGSDALDHAVQVWSSNRGLFVRLFHGIWQSFVVVVVDDEDDDDLWCWLCVGCVCGRIGFDLFDANRLGVCDF